MIFPPRWVNVLRVELLGQKVPAVIQLEGNWTQQLFQRKELISQKLKMEMLVFETSQGGEGEPRAESSSLRWREGSSRLGVQCLETVVNFPKKWHLDQCFLNITVHRILLICRIGFRGGARVCISNELQVMLHLSAYQWITLLSSQCLGYSVFAHAILLPNHTTPTMFQIQRLPWIDLTRLGEVPLCSGALYL